jgi:HSP20 family protein
MNGNGSAATTITHAPRIWAEIDGPVVGRAGQSAPPADGRQIRPPIDVYEIADALIVKAFVPEAHLSDLDVTIGPDGLHLAGRLGWAECDDAHRVTWHRREFGTSRFAETVALPVPIDADRAVATYDDGVLALVLPKAAQPAKKRLRVRSHQAIVDLG